MSKADDVVLLKSLGFSHIEIARELYPEDYKRMMMARGEERRRLRKLLQRRVWRLLRFAGERGRSVGPRDGCVWGPAGCGAPDLELDEGGGERDPLKHRAPQQLENPKKRKAGLRGIERQAVEYEQFIYNVYRRLLAERDPGYHIWATARVLHSRAFQEYYALYTANVWGPRPRSAAPTAYAYAILSFAGLVVGRRDIQPVLFEWLRRRSRAVELLPHIAGIVAKYAVVPVIA